MNTTTTNVATWTAYNVPDGGGSAQAQATAVVNVEPGRWHRVTLLTEDCSSFPPAGCPSPTARPAAWPPASGQRPIVTRRDQQPDGFDAPLTIAATATLQLGLRHARPIRRLHDLTGLTNPMVPLLPRLLESAHHDVTDLDYEGTDGDVESNLICLRDHRPAPAAWSAAIQPMHPGGGLGRLHQRRDLGTDGSDNAPATPAL